MQTLTIIEYLTAAAFVGMFVLTWRHRGGRAMAGIAVGAATTGLWAAALASRGLLSGDRSFATWTQPLATALDITRIGVWLLTLLLLIKPARSATSSSIAWLAALGGTIGLMLTTAILDVFGELSPSVAVGGFWPFIGITGHLAFGLLGLMVVENVWRNVRGEQLWSVKFLLIAVGLVFAFDFYCYADGLLFGRLDGELFGARPLVALMTAPLIGLALSRNLFGRSNFAISRQFAFHSAALLGGGLYLLIMGAAGLYIRSVGGSWGPVTQTAFLVGAGALLASILASGSFRARAKLLIARHLFADKYDYRREWLRFIAALATEDGVSHLRLRVIKAIAQIVESPGGSLWLLDESSRRFVQVESWNDRPVDDGEPATGSLPSYLARTRQAVDLEELAKRPDLYEGLHCPDWLRAARSPWLIVPLLHLEQLSGFMLLQRSRAPRRLDHEDQDLLSTIGRQAAGFLAEHQAQVALDDAKALDLFNRRFAFVVHDVKTMISQLSLLLANAAKHGRNPAFQSDLIATIRDSVDSMNRLLGQINAERSKASREASVDLVALVRRLVAQRAGSQPGIVLDSRSPRLDVTADEARMTAIVGHLLQNAVDAARHTVRVALQAAADGTRVVIEVEDDGAGMEPDFVRDQLFRPFASTKRTGFGIGAFQCRELTRELGGWLTVASSPGNGTTMRVTFPARASSTAGELRAKAAL